MDRIVLAVDGSEHATRAARVAGDLSGSLGAGVEVIHVVPDSVLAATGAIEDYARIEKVTITQRELLESIGARVVTDAADEVRSRGGRVGSTNVLIGTPAREIVEYAEGAGADCIVMGRRGLGDIAGLFMGSVSHKVGHLTPLTLMTTE